MKDERDEEKTGQQGGNDDEGSNNKGEGGGAADPLSRRQFLDAVSTSQIEAKTPEEGELTPEQIREIRDATRDYIEGVEMDFEDVLPDATRGQMQEYTQAALEGDHAKMIKIILDANKVVQEKEDQDRRESGDDLHVQRGGSGRGDDGNQSPTSMRHAMAAAARGLRNN